VQKSKERERKKKKDGRLGRQSQTKPPLYICAILEGRGCRDKPNDIKEGCQ